MPKRDVFISIMEAASKGHGILLSKSEVFELIRADGIEEIARERASQSVQDNWRHVKAT